MDNEEERLREFGAIIVRLIKGENLTKEEARECWSQICEEDQNELQQGAFISAIKAKPETAEEIAGAFEALYEHDTVKVSVDTPEPLIDNCGTGADTLKTINVSTGAGIIASACGLYVVRHAARAISSNCGAIDVIEALGVDVESGPSIPTQSIEKAGICAWNAFLTSIHPKTLARVLSQIRFGSTINLVGPLLNPTMPSYKVMGVPDVGMINKTAETLHMLGLKKVFIMHGLDRGSEKGMDEISTLGPTHVAELGEDGSVNNHIINPEDFGIKAAQYDDIASTRAVHSDALALLSVLSGKDSGPRRDIMCINAAPMLYIMGKAKDLQEGFNMSVAAIEDGRALEKLRTWVTHQNIKPEDGLPVLEKMLAQI